VTLSYVAVDDFRCFASARLEPDPEGVTAVVGPNGSGKTSLLEALAYLGTQRSFRGATRETMVRRGAERAIVRAEFVRDGSPVLVEAELALEGRSRAQVNRQAVRSRHQLAEAVAVTVFSPEDLGVVQGSPGRRRELLDEALDLVAPGASAAAEEVERVLRQRGALLRQSGGRLSADVETTLEVWDDRLAAAGTRLADAREALVGSLGDPVAVAYGALAGHEGPRPSEVTLAYRRSWMGHLGVALRAARHDDLRRGVSTVGPHRDELEILLDGGPARSEASQGEQRCLALALRLGLHRLVTEREGRPPILLLDDVFSELDPARSRALVHQLPAGQTLLTTAVPLPEDMAVAAVVDVRRLATEGAR